MIADGYGGLAKEVDLDVDGCAAGLRMRSQRYAMVVDDCSVSKLFVEEPRALDVSSVEHVLANI